MEKLNKNIVGETLYPVDVLTERILRDSITIDSIKPIGDYKTLITFATMEDALTLGANSLGEHFDEIRKWFEDEFYQTRRVWLECTGIPPHAWYHENFIKIGDAWGKFACLDEKTREGVDFSSAKILINTCFLQTIQRWIVLLIIG